MNERMEVIPADALDETVPGCYHHAWKSMKGSSAFMANIIELRDLSLPELDVYARLTEHQLRSRRDPTQAVFIAESIKVINHALDAGLRPISLLMEQVHIEGNARELIRRCGDIPVYTGSRELLSLLTGYVLTRGVLCAMQRPEIQAAEEILENAQRVAVLEDIVDPTNLGAIFRNAAALGVDAVLLSPSCCDPLHRRAVRVSMGTVFQVHWARLGKAAADWPDAGIQKLKELGFRIVAMSLDDSAVSIEVSGLQKEERIALVLGTEGDGLRAETVQVCGESVCIPMAHGVDSLNVAAAAAIAFWELRIRKI